MDDHILTFHRNKNSFQFDRSNPDLSLPTFTCPVIENADSVNVVSGNFESKNLLEKGLEAAPMQIDGKFLTRQRIPVPTGTTCIKIRKK